MLQISAKNLGTPALISIRDYADKRFTKINRLVSKLSIDENLFGIRLNVEFNRSKKEFAMKAIATIGGKTFIVEIVDKDFRKGIDIITDRIRRQILKDRDESWLNYHN
ncbi:MAG: HPF/RaiA family ribosome-associated protein [Candidatus Dojkabacteria bacterium]